MLKNLETWQILLINLFLGTVWHLASLFACVKMDKSYFDENKSMYKPRKWEKNNKIYRNALKIWKWKDKLPQRVAKDGFSKEHIEKPLVNSVEYLDEFIMETCRGEWCHTVNCLYSIVAFLINPLWAAVLFSLIAIIGNLPFLIIQRFNRSRLVKLRSRIAKRNKVQSQ